MALDTVRPVSHELGYLPNIISWNLRYKLLVAHSLQEIHYSTQMMSDLF